MFTIYVYVLETLADWELGYVTSELHSGRFFKKDAECVSLKTVSYSKEPIHTAFCGPSSVQGILLPTMLSASAIPPGTSPTGKAPNCRTARFPLWL